MVIVSVGDKMAQYYANKIQYVNIGDPINLIDINNTQSKFQKAKWIKINKMLYQCSKCGAVQLKSEKCKYCKAKMEMDI